MIDKDFQEWPPELLYPYLAYRYHTSGTDGRFDIEFGIDRTKPLILALAVEFRRVDAE